MAKTIVLEKEVSMSTLNDLEQLNELGIPVSSLARLWKTSVNYVKMQIRRFNIPCTIRETDGAMHLSSYYAAELQSYLLMPKDERPKCEKPSVNNPRLGRYKDYYRKSEVIGKLGITEDELDNLIINGKLTPVYLMNENCKHTSRQRPDKPRKRVAFSIKEVEEFERNRHII